MPQGKFKKAKLPSNLQKKLKQNNTVPFTRRSNAPIQAKKGKFTENQKIKQVISKSVNKSVESELRSRASEGHINLSKAQQAVIKQNQSIPAHTTSKDSTS